MTELTGPMDRASRWNALLHYLLEPAAEVEGVEIRRIARLLSGFLLVLIVSTGLMALNSHAPELRREAVSTICLIFIPTYFLSRTRFFDIAGYITVLALAYPPLYITIDGLRNGFAGDGLAGPMNLEIANALRWLAMPIITAGFLLTARGVFLVYSALFGAILLLPAMKSVLKYKHTLEYAHITETLIFLTLTTALIGVTAFIRKDNQQRIRERTEALRHEVDERKKIAAELAQHRDQLEVIVAERTAKLARANADLEQKNTEVEKLKNQLQAENIYLQEEIKIHHNFEDIICEDETFKKMVLNRIEQVAASDRTNVIILGESGTGKELVARNIHNLSNRRERLLITVNCATLPASLVESELFGHEKGSFTGAHARKIGKFEHADKSTIFLDEIGEMPIALQAKLLRVLEEGEFERIGNPKPIKVDVRVIAATNRNLEEEIRRDNFREDLFYRLNVFAIHVPPLRERQGDIALLVQYFVNKFADELGKDVKEISQRAMDALTGYQWPGNIRELRNVIENAVIVSSGIELALDENFYRNSQGLQIVPGSDFPEKLTTLADAEREAIERALEHTDGRINGPNGAAKILGLNPNTLRSKIDRLGGIKRIGDKK